MRGAEPARLLALGAPGRRVRGPCSPAPRAARRPGVRHPGLSCLVSLWNKESGWNVYAYNPAGGAYGIPQSFPGSKMASAGVDWQTNPATQITWGLGYIAARYGTPCAAWANSQAYNSY
ncbi:transglycosylase SLT domain-containing protein [Frondihabitans peucedani]|uniref:aggregation-promoting factor C-terminal-like domain-containing protein n=1 Tax=Frondihabitans peucedani TaxID=598626 RepID=UPI003CD08A81